jgi:hypothetical protein
MNYRPDNWAGKKNEDGSEGQDIGEAEIKH